MGNTHRYRYRSIWVTQWAYMGQTAEEEEEQAEEEEEEEE